MKDYIVEYYETKTTKISTKVAAASESEAVAAVQNGEGLRLDEEPQDESDFKLIRVR